MARPRTALVLLSLAAVLFEIALTRVASVLIEATLTAVVVAGCLAALGLGAALAGRRLEDPRLPVAAAAVASLGGAAALAVVVATPLGFAAGVFTLPFVGVGAFAAWVYARGHARLAYAAEALGGAAGAVLAPFAIGRLGDVNAALAAAAVAGLAGLLVGRGGARAVLLATPALLALNLASPVIAVEPWSEFGFRPHLVSQTRDKGGRVVETAYDAFARTDLVTTDEPFLRYLFTDRMYTARLPRWDGASPVFAEPELTALSEIKGLAFRALRPERVLVLGAGGGFDVALALQAGARAVDAVEINGAMIRMTRAQGDFGGRVYDRPEVAVHEAEARRFVRTGTARYDLVSLSLMQTDPAVDRANTGFQSWVFTREAVGAYLDRLSPTGAVAIVQNTLTVSEKTLATCLAALRARGFTGQAAFDRLYAVRLAEPGRNPFAFLVVVSAAPLGDAAERLDAALEPGFVVDARPGGPFAPRLAGLVTGTQSLEAWVAAHPERLDPPTDDRPFFFDLHRAVPGVFASVGLFGLALFTALLARDQLASAGPRLPVTGWLAAGALGAGFLLLEAGLIARGQFLVGMPTPALATVIGSILVAASLGAVSGPRLVRTPGTRLLAGATAAAAVALLEALAWPWLATHAADSTLALLATTAGLVALVGFPVGFCLPSLFEIHGTAAAASIYAANATATVAASAASTLVAQSFGLRAVFVLAALAYAACALLAARRHYNARVDVARSLRTHVPVDALEGAHLAKILGFVNAHPQPFDRAIAEGHLTGSAVVISRSGDRVLLLHHKKLGLWLQPGGHGDPGETTGESVALREALEETGIRDLELHPTAPRPFDVDVHPIPARPGEPAHEHLDLRYLVLAPDAATAVHDPNESHAIRWFTWAEIDAMDLDAGLRRALLKTRRLVPVAS